MRNSFIINFGLNNWYKKKDIICYNNYERAIVTWVYRYRWWKKLLNWFGYKISSDVKIKVKKIDEKSGKDSKD